MEGAFIALDMMLEDGVISREVLVRTGVLADLLSNLAGPLTYIEYTFKPNAASIQNGKTLELREGSLEKLSQRYLIEIRGIKNPVGENHEH